MENQERKSKQVIVMRTDLRNKKGEKVRSGKLIAQGAHASLKAILDIMNMHPNESSQHEKTLYIDYGSAMEHWILDLFTKICLKVDSEKELLDLYEKAKATGLPCALILDSGLTEFDKPTYTCMAVGPGWSDEIDAVTAGLSLF